MLKTRVQLKEQIAADFSATCDQLCVIFAGKILGDTDRLNECGVKEGMTLHLVIKSANRVNYGTYSFEYSSIILSTS